MATVQTSRLLDVPPEIRTMIYGHTTAKSHTTLVRGPDCATPALAQTCSQLRKEVIRIWLESNTFHLTDTTGIRKWVPIDSLTLINSITLTFESSVMWYHTFKHYDIQPTRIMMSDNEVTVDKIAVVWASHARIIASFATNPRQGAIRTISELGSLLDERRILDDQRAAARFEEMVV